MLKVKLFSAPERPLGTAHLQSHWERMDSLAPDDTETDITNI
ncbi:hypothetical protein [Glutamicibacter ardleyensis]